MRHAFVMDPLEGVKPHKDTTYLLMLAARERGHDVFYIDPSTLHLRHDETWASVTKVDVCDDHDCPFESLSTEIVSLATMDIVWIRTDPPFDRGYFYVTLLLDYLPDRVQIINRPATVRDWNEKLAALRYPRFTPHTLVSRRAVDIQAFFSAHERITIKPVDGHGGKGIIFLDHSLSAEDQQSGIERATRGGRHWVVVQEYLPAARDGDKRILLLDGQPLGAILRVHAEDVELNNLDQGGRAINAELDDKDQEICDAISEDLVAHGVRFAGIDVIGGMLIEVNITSPTGLREMSDFDGIRYHHKIIERLER